MTPTGLPRFTATQISAFELSGSPQLEKKELVRIGAPSCASLRSAAFAPLLPMFMVCMFWSWAFSQLWPALTATATCISSVCWEL